MARILIIEDDTDINNAAAEYLRRRGPGTAGKGQIKTAPERPGLHQEAGLFCAIALYCRSPFRFGEEAM